MAKADLGIKRACLSCGMKFYDFKRTPIICPGCSTEFNLENLLTSRKGRSAAKSAVSKAQSAKLDDADDQDENLLDDEDGDDENASQTDDNDVEDDDLDYDVDDDDVSEDADGPGIIQDEITDDDELLPNLDDGDEN
ncbi:TIGR02300 family protein [Alphaproteobacteria bacterium]|nr:TIGR02300 family protein [Alphaproteobacteria bacterium]